MNVFRNIIVSFAVIGIFTRITSWILYRKQKITKRTAAYLSMIIVGVITSPFVAAFVGFDVLISQYLIALLSWLIIDLMWFRQVE